MKRILIMIILFAISGCATLPEHFTALEDHTILTLNEVLERIEDDRVIFIGETHDTTRDHLVQFEVIKYLQENGRKVAIALELLPSSQQAVMDKWTEGHISRYDFARKYDYLWDYYGEILEYSREESIPVIGINADRALIERVSKNGPKVLSEKLHRKYKVVSCLKDTDYAKQLGLGKEGGYHSAQLFFLCDGQRLRDSIMAYNLAGFIKKHNYAVVVIAGVAHASKVAVPRMLQEHIDVSYKVLMPDSIKVIINRESDIGVADYEWK